MKNLDLININGKRVNCGIYGGIGTIYDTKYGYILIRDDREGWNPIANVIEELNGVGCAGDLASLSDACWFVALEDIESVLETTPVEPTAPMTAQVLQMLRKKGDVTSIEAQGVLRCRSLSKRISELKRLGHKISRTLHEDHTGQRYARYILAA
jgi:hypothetical protein